MMNMNLDKQRRRNMISDQPIVEEQQQEDESSSNNDEANDSDSSSSEEKVTTRVTITHDENGNSKKAKTSEGYRSRMSKISKFCEESIVEHKEEKSKNE